MDNDLYNTNYDIIMIVKQGQKIGWEPLKEQTIQRILYLLKVLYFFVHDNDNNNIFSYYHFSISIYGPYSRLIERSLSYLQSNQFLEKDAKGGLKFHERDLTNIEEQGKIEWVKTIFYILSKYGENKIFGFTINDPLYKDAVASNSQKELEISPESKTIQVLNSFKKAFEETIGDKISSIKKTVYLDLYFDYVFSQIIK